jgi:molybdopterin-containing oxidoreductase family iron-sulfur binding subunit
LSTPIEEEDAASLGRREVLRVLGASAALAGLGACTQAPREKILPYAQRVAEVTPGIPTYYATSCSREGLAVGVLVESHEGRPTKIEGNPEHPASLGASGAHEQAAILDLYSPSRLGAVRAQGAPAGWQDVVGALQQSPRWRPWLVLPPQSSPLIGALSARVLARYPAARFSFVSPLSRERVYEATRLVFGRPLEPRYDFARARVVLSLDADFLAAMPMSLRWAREFANARRAASPASPMNRLYQVEPMPTPTGSLADHRLALRTSAIASVAGAILRELTSEVSGQHGPGLPQELLASLPRAPDSPHAAFIGGAARDLAGARGASIVIAGDLAPLELHVLAHALNATLGNLGQTVTFGEPAIIEPVAGSSLFDLTRALDARSVDAVIVIDENPVYWAPPALELARHLREAPASFHFTRHQNETSAVCRWVAPLSHELESWGDARAADGTVSLIQPLIEPLRPSRSAIEILAACAGEGGSRSHALLTAHWRSALGADFEAIFEEHVRRGLIEGTASGVVDAAPRWSEAIAPLALAFGSTSSGPELHFEPSPLHGGRFAGNAWLLELPHPMTKQTWGNAAVISPGFAAALGVTNGRVLELAAGGERLEAPALLLPGHADDVVTLGLGYGQSGPELAGRGVGVNAFRLREDDRSMASGLRVRVTDRTERLAITQDYGDTRGRPLALLATVADWRERPQLTEHLRGPAPSLLPMVQRQAGPQWAMSIDTSICTGCSACVLACQAENNVPVVGKAGVERGREMHWLRIDRYFFGDDAAPRFVHQPMLCQHCETAPCEYVCPVNATVHSPDGLNEMVYNRCIGTRFCSNNCPYKVRRFNYFEYTGERTTEQLGRNPDVTVRERGVMEKCTYCVQRIRRGEMQARTEGREIAPGEVQTACQQACPTRAIQFGSLGHRDTPVVQWREESRAYAALHDLGTRPRTMYLAKIENPNPELKGT